MYNARLRTIVTDSKTFWKYSSNGFLTNIRITNCSTLSNISRLEALRFYKPSDVLKHKSNYILSINTNPEDDILVVKEEQVFYLLLPHRYAKRLAFQSSRITKKIPIFKAVITQKNLDKAIQAAEENENGPLAISLGWSFVASTGISDTITGRSLFVDIPLLLDFESIRNDPIEFLDTLGMSMHSSEGGEQIVYSYDDLIIPTKELYSNVACLESFLLFATMLPSNDTIVIIKDHDSMYSFVYK